MADIHEVMLARKRQKQRKQAIALLMIFASVLAGLMIYLNRTTIFSNLKEIGTKQVSNLSAETDGSFLLTVSGGVEYHAEFVNSNLFVLCDKYLYIYDADGELLDSRQHSYSNAVMKTNGNRALTYSWNSNKFRVDTQKKILYEIQTEQPIWFAVLSDDGKVAVVTDSETYACRLTVFDVNGKLKYTRDCVERLTDVSFTENGCLFSTIGAENGELLTTVQSVQFDKNQDIQWTAPPLATLCQHIYALKDGGAFVIGDTMTAYYDNTGTLISSYEYHHKLMDFSFSGGNGAVLLQNEERRQSIMLLFTDAASEPASVTLDTICKTVRVQDGSAFLLDTGNIKEYSMGGKELSSLEIQNVYEKILKNGKYFYLLGYDRIQRVSVDGN